MQYFKVDHKLTCLPLSTAMLFLHRAQPEVTGTSHLQYIHKPFFLNVKTFILRDSIFSGNPQIKNANMGNETNIATLLSVLLTAYCQKSTKTKHAIWKPTL